MWTRCVALFAMGCGGSTSSFIVPDGEVPIGVGLVDALAVRFERCEPFERGGECVDESVVIERAEVEGALRLVAIKDNLIHVEGVRCGTARLDVETDHGDVSFEMKVVPVEETRIDLAWAPLPTSRDRATIRYLTGSTVAIRQDHRGTWHDGFQGDISGLAGFVVEGTAPRPGFTSTYHDVGFLEVGSIPGQAIVSTEVGGELAITIVELAAMDRLEVWHGGLEEELDTAQVYPGPNRFPIVPFTREGELIIGLGTTAPSVVSSCPDVVPATLARTQDYLGTTDYQHHHLVELDRLAPGACDVEVTWAGESASFRALDPP